MEGGLSVSGDKMGEKVGFLIAITVLGSLTRDEASGGEVISLGCTVTFTASLLSSVNGREGRSKEILGVGTFVGVDDVVDAEVVGGVGAADGGAIVEDGVEEMERNE